MYSPVSIEDLISDIDFVDSLNAKTLQLMIGAESYIPFAVKAEFEFLDENGQPVDLSLTEEGNILNIPAPQEIRGSEVIKSAEALLTIALDQKGLENLPKVKSIVYKHFWDIMWHNKAQYATQVWRSIRLALSGNPFLIWISNK